MTTQSPIFREAMHEDIREMQIVRNAVRENVLSNPALITFKDYEEYLAGRGKGWVCTINGVVVAFAIVDLKEQNVWALFVASEHEKKGIGKHLHSLMLNWYFIQTKEVIWLTTAFNTRAEKFYRLNGWIEVGKHGLKEIKFVMTYEIWKGLENLS
jgi:GNAT superfamily N-acetyltransferase